MMNLPKQYYIKRVSVFLLTLLALLGVPAQAAVVDFQRTVVVSPVGPTSSDNGLALLAAVTSITSGAPSPSVTDPYLLKLEPGVYDVGTASVVIPTYVDLEGSGEGVTLVRGVVTGELPPSWAVIALGPFSSVRHLTVENNASSFIHQSTALILEDGASADHVTAIATGNEFFELAIAVTFNLPGIPGVHQAHMSNVTATAANRAINVAFPGLLAENLVLEGNQGMHVQSGNVFIRDSRISGADFALSVSSLSETVDVVTTQVSGEVDCFAKNCRCFASYDENLDKRKKSCKAK